MIRRLFVIFLLTLLIYYTRANTQINFEVINTNQGLLSDEVVDIFQDNEGFLWFFTKNGINYYDGYQISNIKIPIDKENGLHQTHFTKGIADDEGNVYLTNPKVGLVVYNKKSQTSKRVDLSGLVTNRITSLINDGAGNIWIGTLRGLVKHNISTGVNEVLLSDNGPNTFGNNQIGCVAQDKNKNIWVGNWGKGIAYYNSQKKEFISHSIFNAKKESIYNNKITFLYADPNGYLWVNSWKNGVFICDVSNPNDIKIVKHLKYHDDEEIGNIVFDVLPIDKDTYWLGTPAGLISVKYPLSENPQIESYKNDINNPNGISYNDIRKVFKDRSGVIWLATLGGGVNKIDLDKKMFTAYNMTNNSSATQTVTSFFKTTRNELLIGVKGEGFGSYDRNTNTFVKYSEIDRYRNLSDNYLLHTVNCFHLDNNNNLWLGTHYEGIIRQENSGERYIQYNEFTTQTFSNNPITKIVQDRTNRMWVCTTLGLYLFTPNGSDYNITIIQDDVNNNLKRQSEINSVVIDNQDRVWIGTADDGVILLENAFNERPYSFTKKSIKNNKGEIFNDVQSIFEDSKHSIWVGTNGGGLYQFDADKAEFKKFDRNKGFNEETIMEIIEDHRGDFWISSNSGLFSLDVKNDYSFTNYTVDNGLQGNYFNSGAALLGKDGFVYFGGNYGFNAFNPEHLERNNYIPQIHFTKVKIDELELRTDSTIVLTHKDNVFAAEFAALSYSNNHKNQYSFKLDGYDKAWRFTDAKSRVAQYSNLRPGQYTLLVKGANSNNIWNNDPIKLRIKVIPSPFKTWYAFLFYFLIIFAILYLFFRVYANQLKAKQSLVFEKISRQKEESLNQFKFRFFTNISHELLTPISVVSCISEEGTKNGIGIDNVKVINNNVEKLRYLIKQLLEFRKVESGNQKISVQKGNLTELLINIHENFTLLAEKKKVILTLDSADNLMGYFDFDAIDKVVHNLLSNAIKYTEYGGSVSIKATIINEELTINIADTGKGIPKEDLDHIFDRFYRFEGNVGNEFGMGIGLALTKGIIEQLKGSVQVESQLGKGSFFTVKLPCSRAAFSAEQISENEPLSYQTKIKVFNQADNEVLDVNSRIELDNDKSAKLLIVEDNADLLRMLCDRFRQSFVVYKAINGKQGMEIINAEEIDLVISDVMMPEMDGFQLCKQIKENIETSHIPVILLTAKIDESNIIEGYSAGADSYINKPVNLSLLQTRIESILHNRSILRKKFKNSLSLPENDTKLLPIDEEFVKKAKDIVLKNLSNDLFSVKDFYTEMGASNSTLYRKLNSFTGMKPNEFIKHIRLHTAAQYLKSKTHTVSEAATETGFSDLSYFGSCFRKEFGTTPSDYLKRS